MKTPITVRIDAELLAAVRSRAKRDDRTLTNSIETVLKAEVHAGETVAETTQTTFEDEPVRGTNHAR